MATFKELGVSKAICESLEEMGIVKPTEIQESAIPILLQGKTDFVGQAQTGTGKTAAFGIPALLAVDPMLKHTQILILSPTRELGQQIGKQLFKYTKHCNQKIFIEVVFGGAHIGQQMERLRRPTHVIVATPGRLMDLLERKAIDLSKIKVLILDEADEMLRMGFRQDVDKILLQTDGARNTWLFSATMPENVLEMVKMYISADAPKVQVAAKKVINKNIEHQFLVCTIEEKVRLVYQFLRDQGKARGVIFCKTKAGAQKLVDQIKAADFSVDTIHGDLTQKERDKALRAFRNKTIQVLVATDVAARGIDVEDIAYVLHYQLPEELENYTHRSGRTARAGRRGLSVVLALVTEMPKIKKIEEQLGISFQKLKR